MGKQAYVTVAISGCFLEYSKTLYNRDHVGVHGGLIMGKSSLTDATIERLVRRSPGLSLYQLTRRTGWEVGKVDGSVRRLVNSRRLFVVASERNGRKLNQVFPIAFKPTLKISVPSKLLRTGNPSWSSTAYLYALDSNTIGVAGGPLRIWREIARFISKVPVRREGGRIRFTITQDFVRFYHLENRFFTKTINANNILIHIAGPIVESKPYPS